MSLGSLTTTFAPAPTCVRADHFWREDRGNKDFYVQQGPPFTQAPECFPSGFLPVSTSYYSPGVCPSSYTPACSSTLMQGDQQVTAHVCCPSFGEYSCPPDDATEYSRLPFLTTFGCWSEVSSTMTITVTQAMPKSNIVTTGVYWAGVFGAYAINVRFNKDEPTFPTETGTATPRIPSIAATSVAESRSTTDELIPAETSPAGQDTATTNASAISTSAAAGIGVGSGLGVILLALLAVFLARRLRKKGPASHNLDDEKLSNSSRDNRTELLGSLPNYHAAELAGSYEHTRTHTLDTKPTEEIVSPESPVPVRLSPRNKR
ncbi:hypothetical protein CTRI78_v007251 [Colletotrichum trifolii]|uniref:Uncharacterized protein n=1 Tax=Colletotrichum trifolii TaxID=5466 RepID=A0A4R8RFQ6_COLTR|nr:hypothetical protein CTRI78_v007251 [Colletotrichum trifolii]